MSVQKKRILIIDDEEDLCTMLALQLQCLGFDVDYAFNGEEGIEKIKYFNPDMVLLDIVMPVMDGWEVCDYIKKNPQMSHIKVFLITATQSSGFLAENAKKFGADANFLKPFEESKFFKSVCRALA